MYEVFDRLLKEKGLTSYRVAKDTGLNPAMFSSWKKGDYTPKQDKLQKIADYLGVTLEYLMTGEPPKEISVDYPQLDERTKEFIQLYLNADPHLRDTVFLALKASQQKP